MTATLTEAAVAYVEAGMAVFRLQPRDKKPPAGSNGFKDAVHSAEVVAGWWRNRPQNNIGIATGAVSGFWVLDIDGPAGAEALAALELRFGALPATAEQSTGKGRHICFAWDEAREVRNTASKIGAGIDTRGNGGYIVAAPSIHPSGRAYAWAKGLSPWQVGFMPAPPWLMDLVCPVADARSSAPPPDPTRVAPRVRDGRASKYGETALDNATREVASAAPGRQNETLYEKARSIGRLVAGGEIEKGYARAAMVDAGLSMQASGKPWSRAQVEDMVDRAFVWAEQHPKSAPAQPLSRGVGPRRTERADAPAAEKAAASNAAEALWRASSPAWCAASAAWLSARGLESRPECAPRLLEDLRFHPVAPWNDRGRTGPALLARMDHEAPFHSVEGLAVLPLHPDCERFTHFIGDTAGRAILLGGLDDDLLVAIDLQDAWALAMAGFSGPIAVVPRLSAFAGGALGDTWGRIDPACPRADPAQPPWTLQGPQRVTLAIRRDLRSPPMRVRGPGGRTLTTRLEGERAAAFYGGLALQHWRMACPDLAANGVRAIQARGAGGFNEFSRGEAA